MAAPASASASTVADAWVSPSVIFSPKEAVVRALATSHCAAAAASQTATAAQHAWQEVDRFYSPDLVQTATTVSDLVRARECLSLAKEAAAKAAADKVYADIALALAQEHADLSPTISPNVAAAASSSAHPVQIEDEEASGMEDLQDPQQQQQQAHCEVDRQQQEFTRDDLILEPNCMHGAFLQTLELLNLKCDQMRDICRTDNRASSAHQRSSGYEHNDYFMSMMFWIKDTIIRDLSLEMSSLSGAMRKNAVHLERMGLIAQYLSVLTRAD